MQFEFSLEVDDEAEKIKHQVCQDLKICECETVIGHQRCPPCQFVDLEGRERNVSEDRLEQNCIILTKLITMPVGHVCEHVVYTF